MTRLLDRSSRRACVARENLPEIRAQALRARPAARTSRAAGFAVRTASG
jgi:hypothetical protein